MFCRAAPSMLFFYRSILKLFLALCNSVNILQKAECHSDSLEPSPISLSSLHLTESAATKVSRLFPLSNPQILSLHLTWPLCSIRHNCLLSFVKCALHSTSLILLPWFFSPPSLAALAFCWIPLLFPTAKHWKSDHTITSQPRAQPLNLLFSIYTHSIRLPHLVPQL